MRHSKDRYPMNTPTILKKIIDTKALEVASRSNSLPLNELMDRRVIRTLQLCAAFIAA